MNKTKKKLIVLALSTSLLASYISYSDYHPPVVALCEEDHLAFARYSRGKVYIGSKEFLESLDVTENDILVEDLRDEEDPDMRIYNSCKIKDYAARNEIIQILLLYERMYPSDWERTAGSLRLEWLAHNIFHDLNYETHRTTDVDLNNKDEDVFNKVILKTILRY